MVTFLKYNMQTVLLEEDYKKNGLTVSGWKSNLPTDMLCQKDHTKHSAIFTTLPEVMR